MKIEILFALLTHEFPHSLQNLHSTKEKNHVTGNATISSTHVIMAECNQDMLGNEEIIANAKRFLRDRCGCPCGVKNGPRCQQFSEEVVFLNINNCLELTNAKLDLVILANIHKTFLKRNKIIKYIDNKHKIRCQINRSIDEWSNKKQHIPVMHNYLESFERMIQFWFYGVVWTSGCFSKRVLCLPGSNK